VHHPTVQRSKLGIEVWLANEVCKMAAWRRAFAANCNRSAAAIPILESDFSHSNFGIPHGKPKNPKTRSEAHNKCLRRLTREFKPYIAVTLIMGLLDDIIHNT